MIRRISRASFAETTGKCRKKIPDKNISALQINIILFTYLRIFVHKGIPAGLFRRT